MKQALAVAAVLTLAVPLLAQRRVDLFVDAEGVRCAETVRFEPNVTRYEPRFDNGGGIGGGINWFFSDRVSLEMKVAALESRLHVRRTGSDFVSVADLGYAQIYPITALLQWHMLEGTAIRPYVGVTFDNPTGLVVDGGLEISLSRRWSVIADARYTPIETRSHARFGVTGPVAEIDVKPLVVSTGIAFRF